MIRVCGDRLAISLVISLLARTVRALQRLIESPTLSNFLCTQFRTENRCAPFLELL